MSHLISKIFLLSISILYFFACSSSKNVQSDSTDDNYVNQENIIVPDTFVLPEMPSELTNPDARAAYLVMHYWDRFDFSDEKLIERPEITEQAFVDYVNILNYVPYEKAEESLIHTLKMAEINNAMYRHIASLCDKYFYGANSPFRNEEFYIPVLREVLKSDNLSENEKNDYQFKYAMAMKNRVGQSASDFSFTLASGETQKLSSIKSEYLILMFSNPDCTTCSAVINAIAKSKAIGQAFALNSPNRNMLSILTVYPDDNIEMWRSHLSHLPANWIHAYDNGMVITKQKLYDIKAIPTLYLLDKSKKVILKDTSIEAIEAFFEIPH